MKKFRSSPSGASASCALRTLFREIGGNRQEVEQARAPGGAGSRLCRRPSRGAPVSVARELLVEFGERVLPGDLSFLDFVQALLHPRRVPRFEENRRSTGSGARAPSDPEPSGMNRRSFSGRIRDPRASGGSPRRFEGRPMPFSSRNFTSEASLYAAEVRLLALRFDGDELHVSPAVSGGSFAPSFSASSSSSRRLRRPRGTPASSASIRTRGRAPARLDLRADRVVHGRGHLRGDETAPR